MKGIVTHIRTYYFRGEAPSDLSGREPDEETFYDGEGRIVCSAGGSVIAYYRYDPAGRLVRKTLDREDQWREIWTYEYDPEGELLHLHSEKRERGPHYIGRCKGFCFYNPEFYARDDDAQYEPTGEYTDEWFSWEDGGRRRRRELVVHSPEEGERGVMMETYDGKGRLRERWIGEDKDSANHLERSTYRRDGSIKTEQAVNRLVDASGKETVHTMVMEYDRNGNRVACIQDGDVQYRVAYEYDSERNWTRAVHRDALGLTKYTNIRQIEYIWHS